MTSKIVAKQEVSEPEALYRRKKRCKTGFFTLNAITRSLDGYEPLAAQALRGRDGKQWIIALSEAVIILENMKRLAAMTRPEDKRVLHN